MTSRVGWPEARPAMTRSRAKLIFLCGKMAAGNSTFARDLARRHDAVLLVQDELLSTLFPGEITGIPGFVKYSARLNDALADHELHFLDASDAVCRRQLKSRSQSLPAGSLWTTDAEFDAITACFQPPTAEEGFNVVRHARE